MILFFGRTDDPPLTRAISAARDADLRHLVIDQARTARYDLVVGTDELDAQVTVEGMRVPLGDVSAVYARPLEPPADGDPAARARAAAFQEWFVGWLDTTPAVVVEAGPAPWSPTPPSRTRPSSSGARDSPYRRPWSATTPTRSSRSAPGTAGSSTSRSAASAPSSGSSPTPTRAASLSSADSRRSSRPTCRARTYASTSSARTPTRRPSTATRSTTATQTGAGSPPGSPRTSCPRTRPGAAWSSRPRSASRSRASTCAAHPTARGCASRSIPSPAYSYYEAHTGLSISSALVAYLDGRRAAAPVGV